MPSKPAKLIILGCGTSTGVPVPGCRCSICRSEDPKNKRSRTSAFIQFENTGIAIDTGPDFRSQVLREDIGQVDSVLYTHAHADHVLGCDDLRAFNFVKGAEIPIFGTEFTLELIKNMFRYIFDQDPNYMGGKLAQLRPEVFDNSKDFECEGLRIRPFPMEHGSMEVTGFRFGNLTYATDCKRFSERAFEVARGSEILVLDGLRYEAHRTHLTIDESIELSRELAVERTILVHMTHSVDYEEVSAKLPDGVSLAYDGLSIDFDAELAT